MKNNTAIVEKNQTELAIPQDGSVEFLIAKALDKDTPVEVYEKLLSMRREYRAEKSKEAFDDAMAKFQSECPTIQKTKAGGKTSGGQVAYHYAPLENIVEQAKESIKNNGFSYLIKVDVSQNGETKVKATCIVKHKFGHSEESGFEVPLGVKTGVMSAPQVVAAAATFAKRYAFCNAFGIMTGDEDNDGQTDTLHKPEPTYHPDPQVPQKSTPTPQKSTKKIYCSRHFSQLKEKVEITPAEASYSYKQFGFRLCRNCQNAAKEAKNKPQNNPEVQVDVDAINAAMDTQNAESGSTALQESIARAKSMGSRKIISNQTSMPDEETATPQESDEPTAPDVQSEEAEAVAAEPVGQPA